MGLGVTAGQVLVMFCFMGLGAAAGRLGWIKAEANAGLTQVVLWFVLPALIITAFHRPFSLSQLGGFGLAFAVAMVSYAVTIGLARVVFGGWVADDATRRALRFGSVYGNVGFLGLPLVQALLGADGVFYAVTGVTAFNLLVWTHGWSLFSPRAATSWRTRLGRLAKNPNLLALAVGLIVFLLSVPLPGLLVTGLDYLAAMNAPLSMMVIGVSLSALSWRDFAHDGWSWLGTAARNLVFPLVTFGLLWAVPLGFDAKLAVLIVLSCPAAAFLVMFSLAHRVDAAFGARFVCVSTLASIVTLPGLVGLAHLVW
ncbi:MAG: AEC family transporter [Propionibacteriaceae bacterium]|jgi:predicted permease|nr:AEC family transporter [Propionibacteriaceae bacterium]